MRRLIVVLGYSDRGRGILHPVCAQRLAHAATIATEHDAVVLSGWARVPGTRPEAELMAEAWTGRVSELVIDPDARTTVGNATNSLNDVLRVGATDVVVVTSRWHAPRAAAAFR
ncbi:MAG: YdcF family protein [Actinomycetia bacterium]|nr:YdcF family protein [Actinomycetes bacterium]